MPDLLELLTRDISHLYVSGEVRELSESGSWRRRRVDVLGDRVRIEEPPGRIEWIFGESTTWRQWPSDPLPVAGPRDGVYEHATQLLVRSTREHWIQALGLDRSEPRVELISLVGREAWSIEANSGAVTVVDRKTGLELKRAHKQFGVIAEWVAIFIGGNPADSVFSWNVAEWATDPSMFDYPKGWAPN